MKVRIINIVKFVSGYLLFVFIVTIFSNVGFEDEETGKRPEHLITLTEFIVNSISFAAMLGLIALIAFFAGDRNYNFKLILLYFVFLYIFCLFISAPMGITDLDNLPYDLFQNAFANFFMFSFISFFILLKIFNNKK